MKNRIKKYGKTLVIFVSVATLFGMFALRATVDLWGIYWFLLPLIPLLTLKAVDNVLELRTDYFKVCSVGLALYILLFAVAAVCANTGYPEFALGYVYAAMIVTFVTVVAVLISGFKIQNFIMQGEAAI